jgi:hypothetical protein
LSFLLSSKYNEFRIDFLHSDRSHNYLYEDFFVPNFLKLLNAIFYYYFLNGLHGARAPFIHTRSKSPSNGTIWPLSSTSGRLPAKPKKQRFSLEAELGQAIAGWFAQYH